MSPEEIYNQWQLTDPEELANDVGPFQFTKAELLHFAEYYHKKISNHK